MRFKLDVNVGTRGIDLLKRAGHDAVSAEQQGASRSSDEELLKLCRTESRCLITLDLGFANPIRYNPRTTSGIAVIRLPAKPRPEDVPRAILTLIDAPHGRRHCWISLGGSLGPHPPLSKDGGGMSGATVA